MVFLPTLSFLATCPNLNCFPSLINYSNSFFNVEITSSIVLSSKSALFTKSSLSKSKPQQKYIIKKSTEDLAAYAIEPNLEKRKTYLKIGCDLEDVYVYLDGRKVGKTPLRKRLPVSSGWHRIRIDIPGAKKFNKSGIPNPDFRDVYVTKGRTQKVTFKFLNDQEEPG